MYSVNWKTLNNTIHEHSCSSMDEAWKLWHIKIADRNICDVTIKDKTGFRVARWTMINNFVEEEDEL